MKPAAGALIGGALLIAGLWYGVLRGVVQVLAEETWPDLDDDE